MKRLFLDLEGTLIESWTDHSLINTGKIKKIIDTIVPDAIFIFSAAIYNDSDKVSFETFLKKKIEESLGIVFAGVITNPVITELFVFPLISTNEFEIIEIAASEAKDEPAPKVTTNLEA